jgi:hypothetical protein
MARENNKDGHPSPGDTPLVSESCALLTSKGRPPGRARHCESLGSMVTYRSIQKDTPHSSIAKCDDILGVSDAAPGSDSRIMLALLSSVSSTRMALVEDDRRSKSWGTSRKIHGGSDPSSSFVQDFTVLEIMK